MEKQNLYLYEEGNPLTIPLEGQFIQISSQEDGTHTVLEAREQKTMLDGRCLQVFFPASSEDSFETKGVGV